MNSRVVACSGIRAAQAADIPALLALEESFTTDRLSRRNLRHLLTQGNGLVLVYVDSGTIIGDVVLLFRKKATLARVYSLIVTPKSRGKGVARQLMEAAHAAVRQRGLQGLSLEVRVDNTAAQALYARMGYRLERRLHGFYEDGSDALRCVLRFIALDQQARRLEPAESQRQASA